MVNVTSARNGFAVPVFARDARIRHFGVPATVIVSNEADESFGLPAGTVVTIAYDKAPRGHSAVKDVYASSCLPL